MKCRLCLEFYQRHPYVFQTQEQALLTRGVMIVATRAATLIGKEAILQRL